MCALQCNMMTWQIFSLHNTRGVTVPLGHQNMPLFEIKSYEFLPQSKKIK
jgi:hypothetical protein